MCLLLSSNYALSREVSQQDVQRYSTYYSNGLEYIKNEVTKVHKLGVFKDLAEGMA